jgi:hypothetical protein
MLILRVLVGTWSSGRRRPVGVVVSPGMEPIAVGIIESPATEGPKTTARGRRVRLVDVGA